MQRRMLAQGSVGSQAPLTHSSLLVAYPGQCLLLGKYSSELRVSLSFCTGHVTSNQQRLVLVPAMVYGIMLCPRACWMLSSVVTVVSNSPKLFPSWKGQLWFAMCCLSWRETLMALSWELMRSPASSKLSHTEVKKTICFGLREQPVIPLELIFSCCL